MDVRKSLVDPMTMPTEWREKYPRVMRWEDVPEDRRVTPEFVLWYRGDPGRGEAARLSERKCEMAVDYGSRWGYRFGVYARCGIPPLPGESFCSIHGGPKKQKKPKKTRSPRSDTGVCDGWLFDHCKSLVLVLGSEEKPNICPLCGGVIELTPVRVQARAFLKEVGAQP